MGSKPQPQKSDASKAVAELMPNLIRGAHLDFFVKQSVTQTQFLVLIAVHARKRATMSVLAKGLGVTMPTASGVVERLVQHGYLKRLSASGDRRQVAVELTAKGESFVAGFKQVMRKRWEEVLSHLGQEELASFYHVIVKLNEHASREQDYE